MRSFVLFVFLVRCLSAQNGAPYTPLNSTERWDYYLHQTFLSPGIYFASLAAAGGEQLAKDPPEWRQGVEGYTKRAGSILAGYGIQYSVEEAAEAALHYDPRYLRCDCKGGGRRMAHAILWSFLTKNDEGQTRFNAPVMAGAYAGGMIPYLWYPSRYNPLKDGLRQGDQQLGFHVGVNVIKEFSPELKRLFRFKSNP
jgi:hypothetical protein